MKFQLKLTIYFFSFLVSIFCFDRVHAATEFVSIVDTGNGTGTDYSSLSTWEAGVQTDLTAAGTQVFSGTPTSTIADNATVYLCRGGTYQTHYGTVVHETTGQILIESITGSATEQANDRWYTNSSCNSANYFAISNGGDSAIAVAKCRASTELPDTTAVTVSGWTTSSTNYMKIWTDPAENYRHQGKWDVRKYRLEISSDYTTLEIQVKNLIIDGLQVSSTNYNRDWGYGIALNGDDVVTNVTVKNNIVRSGNNSVEYAAGIVAGGLVRNPNYFYNNIVYGFSGTNNSCISVSGDYGTRYSSMAYNNTVFDCTAGFEGESVTYKNNIAQNCTDGFDVWGSAHDYNISNVSGDTTTDLSPSYRPGQVTNVIFADENNFDFHLDSSDTLAKNSGANLYADASLAVITDIDGNARQNSSSTFDIGADENVAKIFRSVGPSATSALATGASLGNMEIIGLTASFISKIPDAVGVGDAIQYDDDNDGDIDANDSIVFIQERIDSKNYSVRKSDGTAPTATLAPDADWSIFRAYTSLANAESGTDNSGIDADVDGFDAGNVDLTTNNLQWNFAVYVNGANIDQTAMEINGWTTAPDNYIRVFAPSEEDETGTSQLHGGSWNTNKYRLEVVGVDWGGCIKIFEDYVRIEGLQIQVKYAEDIGNMAGIEIDYIDTSNSDIRISGSIIRKESGYTNNWRGVYHYQGNLKAWNNIVYDFDSENNVAFDTSAIDVGNSYIYNNTIQNSTSGIKITSGSTVAKNNIVKGSGNTNAYVGTFASGTDYNATDGTDDIGQGSNNHTGHTFSFVNESGDDFHLVPSDTGGKNLGTNLSNDTYISFTNDIDDSDSSLVKIRIYGSSWDIGADEVISKIYRSVAPEADGNLAALATGSSNHLNISGSTATFDTALSDNVGVGDVLEYDDDNDGDIDASDSIAFISGRTSSTVFTIKTATGGVPTAPSAADEIHWNINRAYTSLSNAEAGTENTNIDSDLRNFDAGNRDIVTNSEQWNFACYANGTTADAPEDPITISGWTTSATSYIKIYTPTETTEVGTSQRHQGVWDDSKYNISASVAGNYIVNLYDVNVKIEGLQIENSSTNNYTGGINVAIDSGTAELFIDANILKGPNSSAERHGGIFIGGDSTGWSAKISNNIIYDWGTNDSEYATGIRQHSGYVDLYVYNNTIIGSNLGLRAHGDKAMRAINNITQDCVDGYYIPYGSWGTGSDFNISDVDATDAPNATFANDYVTVTFLNEAGDDFHLASNDTGARNKGMNLEKDYYSPIEDDVDGDDRPALDDWDIGADEAPLVIFRSVAPEADGNLAALATGSSNHLNISGSTATFDTALSDNVGVGDVLEYDDDNDGDIDASDSIAFISGRTSSTVFTIKTATGGVPTAPSAADEIHWNINRAYTSLSNAEAGTENTNIDSDLRNFDAGNRDIVTNSEQWNFACYANGTTADESPVIVSGWTTSATSYIKIYTPTLSSEVGESQRHSGVWDINKFRMDGGTAGSPFEPIEVQDEFLKIEGLQLGSNLEERAADWYNDLVTWFPTTDDGTFHFSNNIVRTYGNPSVSITQISGLWTEQNKYGATGIPKVYVYNNIFINEVTYSGANIGYGVRQQHRVHDLYSYNNTFIGWDIGLWSEGGENVAYLKNNLFSDNTTATSGVTSSNADYNATNLASLGYTSSANDHTSHTFTFNDVSNNDYHLATGDTGARDVGTDLSADTNLAFLTDIDGNRRGSWDIGADEGSVEMVATVMETGGDFDSLSGWEASLQTDLVGSQTLAFSGTLTGSLTDGASVKGATSGATATVVHANEAGDQILLENISGNFESGEKIFLNAPSTAVLDNFNRSNEGPPPSANWSRGYMNLLGQWEVSGNQATVDSLTNGAAHNYWNVGTFGDSEVHAKITTLPTSGSVGMTLRMVDLGGLTPDGYILGIDSDGCAIRRYDDGTSSVLASFGFAVSAGDSFGLSAVGSTLTAYYKSGAGEWTALGSVTDDTYSTAGYISLATDNADVVVDDFGGGTVPNYFTPSDAGNPAIAVAKIDGAWTGADDTAVVIDGWETGPTNYVKIYTTATARHAGVWDDTKYRLSTSEYGSSLRILNTNDVEIDGLQIENTRTGSEDGSAAGINFRDNFNLNLNVSDCIIRKNGIYTPSYIYYSGGISGYDYRNLEIYNNIIYDFIMGVSFHYPANNAKLYLYNNTIKDFGASGNGVGLTEYSSGITFRLKNNLLDGAGDNYNIDTSGDTTEYLNNISSDATSPNSGATDCGGHSCRNQTVTFLNEAGDDFHLSGSDTAAKDAGTDLSADSYLSFTTDIDGDTRPINDTWDIGADETDLVPEEPSVRTEGTKIKGGVKINGGVKFN